MRVTLLSSNYYLYTFVFFKLKMHLRPFRDSPWISKLTCHGWNLWHFPLLCWTRSDSDDVSGLFNGPKVVSLLCYLCINIHVALHRGCQHLCIHFSVRDVILRPFMLAKRDNCQSGFRVFCFGFLLFFAILSLSEYAHWCCWYQAAVEQCASWCGLCHICLACSCLKGLQACQFCCRGHFSNVTSHTL